MPFLFEGFEKLNGNFCAYCMDKTRAMLIEVEATKTRSIPKAVPRIQYPSKCS